jgi:hypothetical protein
MSAVATVRSWLSRLTASVPTAWHYDRLFRWMVIGAGISLMVFVLRPHDLATSRPIASAPLRPVCGQHMTRPLREHRVRRRPLPCRTSPPADRWTV